MRLPALAKREAAPDPSDAAVSKAHGPAGPVQFRLVRYFTVASLVAFAVVAAAFAWFEAKRSDFFRDVQEREGAFFNSTQDQFARRQEEAALRDLLAIHEAGNVNLTRLFANALWERDFAPFVARAASVPIDHCRAIADVVDAKGKTVAPPEKKACFAEAGQRIMALPGFREIDAKVVDSMKKTSVFKIKVFDLRGVTVYSSEHAQIGEDKLSNAGWKRALAGTPASELTHRDRFSAFEGVVENRDLISSYLPVLGPGTDRIVGVFEVYSDVTPFLAQIRGTSTQIKASAAANREKVARVSEENQSQVEASSRVQVGSLLAVLAVLFGVLFLIVRRADGIIAAQELDRDQAHQQLAQSEKMAALGQMVAGVAHQLNTPLGFSKSNVSLVMDQLDQLATPVKVATRISALVRQVPGDKIVLDVGRSRGAIEAIDAAPEDVAAMKEMLGDVLRGIDQMSELVVHMRDFTRLDRARVSEFDVNGGLKSVVYLAKSVIPNSIEVVEAYGPIRQIVCTPSQLNQIFLNLIINASQAIEDRGRITVATREEAGYVRVDVADTGTGIPPEIQERIFEPYFTTKPEGVGTGLGLNVARDIARAHGGDITVDSRPGHGATFTVVLPFEAGGETRAAA
ncbi:MAG: HAMP domain-containing histidine kinase [Betaproteobacteria bacterium]|nr:HAMP domain-containing histidine kinase [Betaproteobacteria bacterium]PWB59183.1 MAG: sensor histidine kinase [Betaproteobacteria bacterium]